MPHPQLDIERSTQLSQRALRLYEQGDADALPLLYHLTLLDLQRPAWESPIDDEPRDHELGRVLEQCEGLPEVLLGLEAPPGPPSSIELPAAPKLAKRKANALLFHVAGHEKRTVDPDEVDTWAPGRRARLAVLLTHGARIDAKVDRTPILHTLALHRDIDALRFAVSLGLDVDATDSDKRTALSVVAEETDVAGVVEVLLALGADPHSVDRDKLMPLLHAAYSSDAAVIRALVAGGADPDAGPKDASPLSMAASSNNVDALQALLAAGATPKPDDLKTAEVRKRHESAAILREALGTVDTTPPRQRIETMAHELGVDAARSARDSGDLHHYRADAQLDPADLPGQYWQARYRNSLERAIRVLPEALRAELPTDAAWRETLHATFLRAYAKHI